MDRHEARRVLGEIKKHVQGWCADDKVEKLYHHIVVRNPQNLVEIGVFHGRSLLVQALACKLKGSGTIIGIDPWTFQPQVVRTEYWKKANLEGAYQNCQKWTKEFGLEDHVQLIRATSNEAHPQVKGPLDWIHIDGNHAEEWVLQDVQNWVPKVRIGGVVVFDDADWAETKKAYQLLAQTAEPFDKTSGGTSVFLQIK